MKAIEMMEVEVDSGDNEEVENILEEYDVEMCQLDSDDDNMDYKNEVYKDIEVVDIKDMVGREDVSPPCFVHGQRERFRDISTMLAFWERQECEEKTPVQEKVVARRRRSTRLEGLVERLGLEQAGVDTKPNDILGGTVDESETYLCLSNYQPQTEIFLGGGSSLTS